MSSVARTTAVSNLQPLPRGRWYPEESARQAYENGFRAGHDAADELAVRLLRGDVDLWQGLERTEQAGASTYLPALRKALKGGAARG